MENTPKKVRIHSELERDNHVNQDELDLQKDIIEEKLSNGRPQLKENELRTKYVKVYCTEEEKKQIYKNYSSSAVMREYLLKETKDGEV